MGHPCRGVLPREDARGFDKLTAGSLSQTPGAGVLKAGLEMVFDIRLEELMLFALDDIGRRGFPWRP